MDKSDMVRGVFESFIMVGPAGLEPATDRL